MAVINLDDAFGRRLALEIAGLSALTYGNSPDADVHPTDISLTAEGISGPWSLLAAKFW